MQNSTETRGLTRRLQDWLYRNRASAAVWAGFVVFALLLAGGLAWGISWINEKWFWSEKWFEGTLAAVERIGNTLTEKFPK